VTGVTFVSSELAGKRIQFLKEAAPTLSRVGVIWNPRHPDVVVPVRPIVQDEDLRELAKRRRSLDGAAYSRILTMTLKRYSQRGP